MGTETPEVIRLKVRNSPFTAEELEESFACLTVVIEGRLN